MFSFPENTLVPIFMSCVEILTWTVGELKLIKKYFLYSYIYTYIPIPFYVGIEWRDCDATPLYSLQWKNRTEGEEKVHHKP